MDSETSFKVTLNCYDLTRGLAKALSPAIIGQEVEAVWHTGIVVYNHEYYFGNGICCDAAGQTPFGVPTKTIDLGETEIPVEMFHDYLFDIKDRFTFMTYNMISNNCNHFTNECAGFLIDMKIPDNILNQAEEFFATPLGQNIKPFIMAAQDMLKKGTSSMFSTGSAIEPSQTVNSSELNNTLSQIKDSFGEDGSECLCENITQINDILILQEQIFMSNVLVLYIWTPAKEECKDSNVEISALADEHSNEIIQFFSVNAIKTYEINTNFKIASIPCVYIYKQGEVIYGGKFEKEAIDQTIRQLKEEFNS